jgi:hypothetical protein
MAERSGDTRTAPLSEFFDSVVGSEVEREYADRVLRDIEVLRRALAFYAEPENWREDDWGVNAVITREYGDAGRTARRTARALRRLRG